VQLSHSRDEAAKAAEAQVKAASEWEAKQAKLKAAKGVCVCVCVHTIRWLPNGALRTSYHVSGLSCK